MKKLFILGYPKCAQRRFWSDCANAQADLILGWTHISERTFSDIAIPFMLLLYCFSVRCLQTRNLRYVFRRCGSINIEPDRIILENMTLPIHFHWLGRQVHMIRNIFPATQTISSSSYLLCPYCMEHINQMWHAGRSQDFPVLEQ